MSSIVARIPAAKARASHIRRSLFALGLLLMALYAVDTYAAANARYLQFDVPVAHFIQSVNWGPLVQLFLLLDWFAGWHQQVLGIAGIAVVAAVNWRAVPLMIAAALSGGIYTLTEMVIQRPRPSADLVNVIVHTGSYSYPSGHVAFFSWFVILLVLSLAAGRLPNAVVGILWVFAALLVLSVCIGRIYLGEHWPSDVLGGLALGLGWTSFVLSIGLLSNPVLARKK